MMGQQEAQLRATYQAARQRLWNSPQQRSIPAPPLTVTVAVQPPQVIVANEKPKTRPREHYVCASIEEQIPTKWIRGVIIEISKRRDVPPLLVISSCQIKRCVAARVEIWATLHDMGVSSGRLAELFNKDHTTVSYGIRRYKGAQAKQHKPRGVKQ